MSHGFGRTQPDDVPELLDGALVVTGLPQRQRQVKPEINLVRLELDRLTVFLYGVDRVVRGPQSVGQTQVELGIARAQARRGAILGHTLADIPRLGERRSEAGVGVSIVRIVGLELDRPAVLLDGA